jgi:integrating conjugative element protein (TIGR03756 family)
MSPVPVQIIRPAIAAALAAGLASGRPAPAADTISTADIIASALASSCLRYQYVGTCYWELCTPYGCTTETSTKYGHYNPDLVVSASNGPGKNPWKDLSGLDVGVAENKGGILGGSPMAPHRDEGNGRKTNLNFKEAQAIGHPATGQFQCPSEATAFQPYFLSVLDPVGWRWSLPETIYPPALVPGLREIGHWPRNTWGAVYPRAGWVMQGEDPKAAAVIVQRVGDIVTRSAQPHIYFELESGGVFYADDKRVWRPPDPLKEGKAKTGDWQMLVPKTASNCAVFGADDTLGLKGWAGGKVAGTGNYAWALWRPYACCEVKGQTFLYSLDVNPFP